MECANFSLDAERTKSQQIKERQRGEARPQKRKPRTVSVSEVEETPGQRFREERH